jgi:3-deoxy-D-manno-octulosonate 8-phosphate phosphatase (KDO 8-P phosphatase)
MTVEARAKAITLLLSDVDGVLTDGRLEFDDQGGEHKQYHIRDGLGIKLWQKAGHRFGIVTGRTSATVARRAAELGVQIVRQGAEDKLAAVKELIQELNVPADQIAYVGDDLPDLPAIKFVGLGIAVADASADVRDAALWITKAGGGHGAVRELIETILKAQGHWGDLLSAYDGGP